MPSIISSVMFSCEIWSDEYMRLRPAPTYWPSTKRKLGQRAYDKHPHCSLIEVHIIPRSVQQISTNLENRQHHEYQAKHCPVTHFVGDLVSEHEVTRIANDAVDKYSNNLQRSICVITLEMSDLHMPCLSCSQIGEDQSYPSQGKVQRYDRRTMI